ncbi:MAG: Hsp20/alpha crystallin family protein [Acidobacteriota bacterium]
MFHSNSEAGEHLALLRDRISKLFDAAAARTEGDVSGEEGSSWSPLVDLYETDDRVVLVAEVPGLSMDDLDVQVTDSCLTLKGGRDDGRTSDPAEEEIVHLRRERAQGNFSRSFQLSTAIDRERVTAEYKNGLLEVTLPKRKGQPRSIRVHKT